MPEVRLVGPNGEQVGIVPISRALDMAVQADLDLVEVAPTARPPVVKIMDYGKFKYENAQKAREARRNQVLTVIKEMKLRPKIDGHDYETKKGHVVRFLKVGDKVKVTIMFRGREQSRPELGFRLLQKLAADVADLGFVESAPKLDGRNMIMVLAPHKAPAKVAKSPTPASGPRPARSGTAAAAEPVESSLLDDTDDTDIDDDDLDDDEEPLDMTDDTTEAEAQLPPPLPDPFVRAATPPPPVAAPAPAPVAEPAPVRRPAPSATPPPAPSRSSAPSRPAASPSAAPRPPAPPVVRPAAPNPLAPRPGAPRPMTTGGTPGKPGGGSPIPPPRPRPGATGRPPKPGS